MQGYKIKTYQKEKQRTRDQNDMKLEQRIERAVTTMNKSQSSQVGKKKKVKKKRVAFKESGSEDERQQVFQRHPNVPPLNLPPKVPGNIQVKNRLPKSLASSNPGSFRKKSYDNSSVENYNRYYQPPNEMELEQPSEESFQITEQTHRQSQNNQMQYMENQRRQKEQTKLNTLFEPRFVRDHNEIRMGKHMINQERLVNPDIDQEQQNIYDQQEGHHYEAENPDMHTAQKNYGLNWIAKPTREGFLYFQIPGTNTYQWSFPKVYDHVTKENKYLFISHWIKKVETTPQGVEKYWYHRSNPSFKQYVKPHSETYLIQAAIEGNLAYLEVYVKFKGDLTISDQQGRTALAHSILNDKKTFTQMICEFSTLFQEEPATFSNLLEMSDRHGNTPLFCAVRVNSTNQLKVLISYKCNLFHRKKNGNTCLHECATFNSVEALILLAPYCGKDLFSIINKEGMRAIDVAKNLKNHDAYQAMQRLERNLMYQDAVIERDHKPMIPKQPSHQPSGHLKKLKKPHLNMIREEELSSLSNSSQMVDRRDQMHLPPRNDIIKKQSQKSFGEFDERKHFQHMHQQKKVRRQQDQQVPNFRNYRDEIMNNQSEEELDETYEAYERSFQPPPQIARNIQPSMQHQISEIRQPQPQLQKEDPYYGRMRHQKNHFEQAFGEESYLKVDDLSRQLARKKKQPQPSRQWFQEDDSYIYRGDEDSQIHHQIDKTLTNYDHSRTHKNSMYNSRLHRSNNYTIDDIEKQKFRVQKPKKRERGRSTSVQSYRNQGQSVVHQAYQNTTRTLVTIASYVYSGYEHLSKIMAVERDEESLQRQPRTSRGRSVQFFEDDQAEFEPNSRSMRFQSMHERRQSASNRQIAQPQLQTTDSEDFQTAYARSKSRMTRQNSQIRQIPDDFQSDEYQQDQQYLNPQIDEVVEHHQIQTHTKSISIQADQIPGNYTKTVETIQKKVEISKHSIGVGSICIDDTVVKNPIKRRKKKRPQGGSASAIADFSKASIASQQLKSSSKLIEYEKTRRTGRKLAKKAQEILMESKHFQSSDEEEKKLNADIVDIEPEPHYIKEELQYLKIAQAYENKDAQMYQQEVSKMAELHKQQEKRMSEHLSQKSSNKRSIEEASAAIQKQSTPTCQSTQREATNSNQQREELKEQNQQIQNEEANQQDHQQDESIDKFYQKLALNNLSLTNIEEQQTTLKKIDNTNERTLQSFLNQCNVGGEVEFDFAECEISLNRYNIDQSDLELGQVKEAIPKQQDEQLQYFSECSFDSIFKECKLENEDKLSDCTFTHVQNGLLCAPERNSKYESINFMNRGQFFKSQNNSLLNQTPTNNINSSGMFQTLLNQNQSGICHNNKDSFMLDFQIPIVDQEKLEQVVKNNIKAIPLPRPGSKLRSGGLRKSTQSMGKKKKSEKNLPDLIQAVEIKKIETEEKKEENQQQNMDEQQAQEVIQSSPEKENNDEIVEDVVSEGDHSPNESNLSSPSMQPGALTQISDENDTPIVDRATVTVIEEDSPRKTDSPNEEEQKIEITDHLDPRSSKNGVLPLFKQHPTFEEKSAEKPQVPIPSTRYSERDEEPSRIDENNSPPENKSGVSDTKTTIEAKQQPYKVTETKRPMKASRGGPSAQAQNTNFLLAPPSQRQEIQQDTTRDLTKIDFDLTQLDTTPREKSVEQNEKILQEIALKIEQEISAASNILKNDNTKVEKSHFREVSLSFETSTFIKDGIVDKTLLDRPLEDVINQTNQYLGYNPIMEPQTSSGPEEISLMNSKIMQGMIQHPTSDSEVQRTQSQPQLLEKLKDQLIRKSIQEKKQDTPGFKRASSTSSIGKEIIKLRKSMSLNSSEENKSQKSTGKPQTAKFRFSQSSLKNFSIKSRENSLDKQQVKAKDTNLQFGLDSPLVLPQQEEQKITTPAKFDSPGTPKDTGKPQKADELAKRLAKLKRPSQLNSYRKQKSVRDISFNNTKANMSMNQSAAQNNALNSNSVMTDNSERLKDTLEQFKQSKLIKEMKKSTTRNMGGGEIKKQQTLDPTSKSSNKVPLAAPRSSRK